MNLVVDASVAAKWFLSEADTALAAELLNTTRSLVAPAILRAELAAAISRRHRLGSIDEATARLHIEAMLEFVTEPAIRLLDNETLLPRAIDVALQIKHPLQDCLYIACAEAFEAELVTSDASFLRRASPSFSFVRALR